MNRAARSGTLEERLHDRERTEVKDDRKRFALGLISRRSTTTTWRKAVEADLKGAPFEKKMISHTYEGIDLQPIYTEELCPSAAIPSAFPAFRPSRAERRCWAIR